MRKKQRREEGAVTAIVVIALAVLLGCAALAVDLGMINDTKERMQAAADLAATAAARELLSRSDGVSAGEYYGEINGAETVTVNTPFNGDVNAVEVICTKHVNYPFATVMGYSGGNVSARAVARFNFAWDGEAFPFINQVNHYEIGSTYTLWDKNNSGDFGCINDSDFDVYPLPATPEHPYGYYCWNVYYHDGITYATGKIAKYKSIIKDMYDYRCEGQKFYCFSISNEAIDSDKYGRIGNKEVIAPEDLVLLECTYDKYDNKNKQLTITVTNVFDINNGDLPTEFLYDFNSGAPRLVE